MSRSVPRGFAAVVAAMLAIASLAACAVNTASASDNVYRIGVLTSQTGAGSQLGGGELNGARLAADQLNAAGGINGHRVELETADTQSSPAQAVLQTRKMLSGVDAIVGPTLSSECKAVLPLATSGKLLDYCLSPGIRPEPSSWQWSASASTEELAVRLIAYWKKRGITRLGLVYTTDSSGVDGAMSVSKAVRTVGGVRLVASTSFSPDAVSVGSQAQTLASAKPQAVVVWSTGGAAGIAFKGLQEAGLDVPVGTTDGNLTYAFLDRIAAFLPKTLLIPATRDFWYRQVPGTAAEMTLERDYHHDYQARFGAAPDLGPGVGYDGVMLLAHAIALAHGDRHAAKTALESVRGFRGVVGTYSMAADDHRGLDLRDVAVVRASRNGFTYASS